MRITRRPEVPIRLPFAAAALLLPALAAGQDAPVRPWTLGGEVSTFSAPVLPGMVLGAELDGQRALSGNLYAALRFGLGTTSDSNEFWLVQQTHLEALAGVGVARPWDAAVLSAEIDAGSVIVRENASRHQLERLTQADIADRTRLSWSAGPLVALRLGVSVELANAWYFRLSAGPQVTALKLNDAWTWRGGIFSGVGVAHAF